MTTLMTSGADRESLKPHVRHHHCLGWDTGPVHKPDATSQCEIGSTRPSGDMHVGLTLALKAGGLSGGYKDLPDIIPQGPLGGALTPW